ncbi:cadherin EGF LAG seven-pass G-type receptor 1-like [Paramormyrops kingsleyae]|uniref:cadherin EGF LAG seven-pass G-type receptor 1-like n=1 Tax=Paramormyrops kingsleyae TaxID=1676925 RepID=UPI003B979262
MQGVRMGETATNAANVNMQEGLEMGVEDGCLPADPCVSHTCPEHSRWSDLWNAFSCVCDPGYFGMDCMDPCQLNPCEHVSSCVRRPGSAHGYAHGYACECGPSYYGQYCEKKYEAGDALSTSLALAIPPHTRSSRCLRRCCPKAPSCHSVNCARKPVHTCPLSKLCQSSESNVASPV